METSSGPTAASTPPGGSHGSPGAVTPGAQDYLSPSAADDGATPAGAVAGQVPVEMQPYFNLGMPSMQTLYPVSFPGAMPATAGMPLMQVLQPMALPGGMAGSAAPFMMQPFQYSFSAQQPPSSSTGESPGTNCLPSPALPSGGGGGSRSGTPSGLTSEQQQRMQQLGMVMAPGVHPGVPPGSQQQVVLHQQHIQQKMAEQSKPAIDPATLPKPPKKPLTPYMRFSKSIWQNVKSQNQSMSVCEIGATIGRMWRELSDEQKQKYNEEFQASKVQYEEDLQEYLKVTGLQPSDLVKPRNKKKDKDIGKVLPRKPSPSMPQRHFAPGMMAGGAAFPAQLGRMAAFGGDQTAEALSSSLPHFSQVWASGQANPMMAAAAAAAAAAKEGGGAAANGNMVSHAYYQAAAAAAAAAPAYGGSPVSGQQRASPHLSTPSPLGAGGDGEVLNFSRSGSWPWPQQQMGTVEQYAAIQQQQQLQQQQQVQMAAAAMNEAVNARGGMDMELLLKQQQQQQQQQQQGSRPSSQNGVDLSMLGQEEQRQPTPVESQPDDASVKKAGNNGTDPTGQQQQQQQRNDYWNMHYPHY